MTEKREDIPTTEGNTPPADVQNTPDSILRASQTSDDLDPGSEVSTPETGTEDGLHPSDTQISDEEFDRHVADEKLRAQLDNYREKDTVDGKSLRDALQQKTDDPSDKPSPNSSNTTEGVQKAPDSILRASQSSDDLDPGSEVSTPETGNEKGFHASGAGRDQQFTNFMVWRPLAFSHGEETP